jgi:hypothetical protein
MDLHAHVDLSVYKCYRSDYFDQVSKKWFSKPINQVVLFFLVPFPRVVQSKKILKYKWWPMEQNIDVPIYVCTWSIEMRSGYRSNYISMFCQWDIERLVYFTVSAHVFHYFIMYQTFIRYQSTKKRLSVCLSAAYPSTSLSEHPNIHVHVHMIISPLVQPRKSSIYPGRSKIRTWIFDGSFMY